MSPTSPKPQEYVGGGELLDRIQSKGCYSEKNAAQLVRVGVAWCQAGGGLKALIFNKRK